MIITKTPSRVSFLGGGTDYQEYYMKYTGCVIATTIDKYCYVSVHNGKVSHYQDLPSGCGMATSSAFTVGLLKATTQLPNDEIASLATEWERDKTGGNCGVQDQYLCAVGGFKRLRIYGSGIVAEDLDYDWLEPYLMLFDTGIYRKGGDVIKHQLDRVEQNTSTLHELKFLALQNYETPEEFGGALNIAWSLKRSLSSDVSTNEVDRYYDKSMDAGAIGGKLLGGGGGGFMVFVVPLDKQDDVRRALKLNQIQFKFEKSGSCVIYNDALANL